MQVFCENNGNVILVNVWLDEGGPEGEKRTARETVCILSILFDLRIIGSLLCHVEWSVKEVLNFIVLIFFMFWSFLIF